MSQQNTNIQDDGVVDAFNFDPSKVVRTGFSQFTVETEQGPQIIKRVNLGYNFPVVPGKPELGERVRDLMIKLPRMSSSVGITCNDAFSKKKKDTPGSQGAGTPVPQASAPSQGEGNVKKDKALTYSLCSEFEVVDDETRHELEVFNAKMGGLIAKAQELLLPYAGQQPGIPSDYSPQSPGKHTITNPLKPKAGGKPVLWVPLEKSGTPGSSFESKTDFYTALKEGQSVEESPPISWDDLANVTMSYIGVININCVMFNSLSASMKYKMVTAVVLSLAPRTKTNLLAGTRAQLGATFHDAVAAQVARLHSSKKSYNPNAGSSACSSSSDSQSTFSGLVPIGSVNSSVPEVPQPIVPTVSTVTTPPVVLNIPTIPTVPTNVEAAVPTNEVHHTDAHSVVNSAPVMTASMTNVNPQELTMMQQQQQQQQYQQQMEQYHLQQQQYLAQQQLMNQGQVPQIPQIPQIPVALPQI